MRHARPRKPLSKTLDGLDAQCHVLGAMIMRELHTRYGRDNIGYLWALAEPILLATSVALIHVGSQGTGSFHGGALRVVPFTLTGYCVFIIFRSIVTRAETALESNKLLLYHRMVTIFDMLLSRALLEILSATAALILLLSGSVALGWADPPADPLLLFAGILLFGWLSFALAMCICAAAYFSHVVGKMVHPAVYASMPLSGAFFVLRWIPEPYRDWISWIPSVQIFEMVHRGQFASLASTSFDPAYILGWCLGLTLIGLVALRVLRRHVHLS